MVKHRYPISLFSLLIVVFMLVFAADIFFGSVNISFSEIMDSFMSYSQEKSSIHKIILEYRLPKAITAIIAGMALSVSGLLMQTIFRNPLAGPFVLGISSGASLGVALLIMSSSLFFGTTLTGLSGNWSIVIAAFLGAAIVLFIILILSIRIKDIMTILILGILFGSAATAIVSILQYFSPENLLKTYVLWTMGNLGNVTTEQLRIFIPMAIISLVIVTFTSKSLNALILGEQYAQTLGIQIKTLRFIVFFITSILAGTTTAFCGPIGFIGIAIPHISRLFFKTQNHFILFPACMLIGGIVLLISDIFSQLPGSAYTLPINSITSIIGIPIVIWIVTKNFRFSSYF
ncbi:iron chelate uptake ABC transporter family permease subunit [Bacteroidota bacterium]